MTSTDSAASALATPTFEIPDALQGVERPTGVRIIQRRLKLPNMMAELLYELMVDELKSNEELIAVGIQHPQLSVQRLRKMIGITIHARRFTGYWLDPNDRQWLMREIDA